MNNKTFLFLFSLLIFASVSGHAANDSPHIKRFDQIKYEKVVKSVDYSGDPAQKININRKFTWVPVIPPYIAKLLIYAFIPLLIIVLLIVLRKQSVKIFRKNGIEAKVLPVISDDVDLDKSSLEQLLSQALQSNNLRLAVRLHYLIILEKLASCQLIEWRPNKTNYHYRQEMRSILVLSSAFNFLTNKYELYWYGEHNIDQVFFDSLSMEFIAFNTAITSYSE